MAPEPTSPQESAMRLLMPYPTDQLVVRYALIKDEPEPKYKATAYFILEELQRRNRAQAKTLTDAQLVDGVDPLCRDNELDRTKMGPFLRELSKRYHQRARRMSARQILKALTRTSPQTEAYEVIESTYIDVLVDQSPDAAKIVDQWFEESIEDDEMHERGLSAYLLDALTDQE